MDTNNARNIEFLDFSDVCDQERRRILSFLQYTINDPVVRFPWDDVALTRNHSYGIRQNRGVISLNRQPSYQRATKYVFVYPPPPQQQQPQPTQINYLQPIQTNSAIVLYPAAIISPVPCLYNNTKPYLEVDNQGFLPNHDGNINQQTNQSINQQIPQIQSPKEVGLLQTQPLINAEVVPETLNGDQTIINQSPTPQQNGLITTTETNQTRKSWASLFNNKKSMKTDEPILMNGTSKPLIYDNNNKIEAVNNNHEPNNNNLCPIKYPKQVQQCSDPNSYRIGEFLLSYHLESRTTSLQPRGLINRSNYCYINSILQALLACPPFYNLLNGLANSYKLSDKKMKSTPFIDSMCRFVKEFQHLPASLRINNRRSNQNQNNNNIDLKKEQQNLLINCDPPFEPSWIYKILNGTRTDSFSVEGRQEDAEEFLGCILNGLNDEILDLMKLVKKDHMTTNKIDNNFEQNQDSDKDWQVMGPKNKGSITRRTEFGQTPISDIFFGLIKSRIHRSGDHYTDNIQPFSTLQLNIEKVQTVRDALEALVSKNPIEGMTSQQTNEEVEAWQQVTLEVLPVVLVLHLKCFDFQLDGCTKIMKALEFPIDLKINSKWMSSKINNQKEKLYKLFAIVYHDGKEATKGHYLTDAFHVGYGSWLRYDDSSVKAINEDQVLKPQGTRVPYLLFYRRRNY